MINSTFLPFPDFKLLEIIDPEQFDLNNSTIMQKIDDILAVLNQLTDSIQDGGSGADKISLTAIFPFTSTKLQTFLEDVINKLKSVSNGSSGADFVASSPIVGVTGSTVFSQLTSLKTLIDGLRSDVSTLQSRASSLESRATNVEGRSTSLESRVTINETSLSNRYTKQETYSQAEINTRLSLGNTVVIDGGTFLDTYSSQIAPVDGGSF